MQRPQSKQEESTEVEEMKQEDTMRKWFNWLEYVKKKDEKEKMEEMHQHKVAQMIKSAEGSAGLLHKITKPTPWWAEHRSWRKKRKRGCWTVVEQRGNNGQNTGRVMRKCRT